MSALPSQSKSILYWNLSFQWSKDSSWKRWPTRTYPGGGVTYWSAGLGKFYVGLELVRG